VNDRAIARRYFVSGMVQGVGFRFFTQRAADGLGVAGYARNLSDGRVEVYAIGTKQQLESLRDLLQRGPRMASVSAVTEEDAAVQSGYTGGFSIEHSM
jgi:acylphosphatase